MTVKRATYIVTSSSNKRHRVDDELAARSALLAECVADAHGQVHLDFAPEAVDAWLTDNASKDLSPEVLLGAVKARFVSC